MTFVVGVAKIILQMYRSYLLLRNPALSQRLDRMKENEKAWLDGFFGTDHTYRIYTSRTPAELVSLWENTVEKTFDSSKSQEFYQSWRSQLGILNILVNVEDQLSRIELVQALDLARSPQNRVLDFGCGTAAVTLDLSSDVKELTLLDVPNLASEYVKSKVEKQLNVKTDNVLSASLVNESYDVIFCIDVLEHLENSSDVFRRIHSALKPGGLLFIQAPWGGIPEHIEEAYANWKQSGGAELLASAYTRVQTLNPLIPFKPGSLSGVYKKA